MEGPKGCGKNIEKSEILLQKSKCLLCVNTLTINVTLKRQLGIQKMFWDTIKPFMTDKVKSSNESISIEIGNSIVNEHAVVANTVNEHFGQVASTTSNDKPIEEDECMESIIESNNHHLNHHLIRDNVGRIGNVFNFQEVNECEVKKLIENLNPKKGPCYDMLPPKLIKAASTEFTKPLTSAENSRKMLTIQLCR